MSTWTMSKVRRLYAAMPDDVRALEHTFVAWIEDELNDGTVGPKSVGPSLIGPVLASKLSQHGVQVED